MCAFGQDSIDALALLSVPRLRAEDRSPRLVQVAQPLEEEWKRLDVGGVSEDRMEDLAGEA